MRLLLCIIHNHLMMLSTINTHIYTHIHMPTSFLDTHIEVEKPLISLFPSIYIILHFLYQFKKLHTKEPNTLAIPPRWIHTLTQRLGSLLVRYDFLDSHSPSRVSTDYQLTYVLEIFT